MPDDEIVSWAMPEWLMDGGRIGEPIHVPYPGTAIRYTGNYKTFSLEELKTHVKDINKNLEVLEDQCKDVYKHQKTLWSKQNNFPLNTHEKDRLEDLKRTMRSLNDIRLEWWEHRTLVENSIRFREAPTVPSTPKDQIKKTAYASKFKAQMQKRLEESDTEIEDQEPESPRDSQVALPSPPRIKRKFEEDDVCPGAPKKKRNPLTLDYYPKPDDPHYKKMTGEELVATWLLRNPQVEWNGVYKRFPTYISEKTAREWLFSIHQKVYTWLLENLDEFCCNENSQDQESARLFEEISDYLTEKILPQIWVHHPFYQKVFA
jgi:hypothetical protein